MGLDFVIQLRLGRKIVHADALSGHAGAVMHEDSLNKENIKQSKKGTNTA